MIELAPKGSKKWKKILMYLDVVVDNRQSAKVSHKIKDAIELTFFAEFANAEKCEDVEVFGNEHEEFLRQYLELPYGIPSHDTIQRIFAVLSPEFLQGFRDKFNEILSSGEGEKNQKTLIHRRKNTSRQRKSDPKNKSYSNFTFGSQCLC